MKSKIITMRELTEKAIAPEKIEKHCGYDILASSGDVEENPHAMRIYLANLAYEIMALDIASDDCKYAAILSSILTDIRYNLFVSVETIVLPDIEDREKVPMFIDTMVMRLARNCDDLQNRYRLRPVVRFLRNLRDEFLAINEPEEQEEEADNEQ